MSDRPWKQEERHAAKLMNGTRYTANSGGRVDVEGPGVVAQVKHVSRLSLSELEQLAVEIAEVGRRRNKYGVLIVKRRGGRGSKTPRLVCMTEHAWRAQLDRKLTQ